MKCAVGCPLAGHLIVVRDEAGDKVGEGRLGHTPWPGTTALYGAEVTLTAPAQEGPHSWSVTFTAAEAETPHDDASVTFSLWTAGPPEHRVTIAVIDQATAVPLANVQVRLGSYRAATDQRGQATVEVPKGRYDLSFWKVGYAVRSRLVEVAGTVSIRVEAVSAPVADPDDDRLWM